MEEATDCPDLLLIDDGVDDTAFVGINGQAATRTLELGINLHRLLIPVTSVVEDRCHDHDRDEQNGSQGRSAHQSALR